MAHSYLIASSSEADQTVTVLSSKGYTVHVAQTGDEHVLTVDSAPTVSLEELILAAAPTARSVVAG